MAGKCPVCGFATDDAICPRCATILLPGEAICPKCGKMFPGRIPVCDGCGRGLDDEPDGGDDRAVRAFALVPGMDDGTARRLVARGFKEFADIIRLGLPESAARKGLHHAISRRIILGTVLPKAPHRVGRVTCMVCHAAVLETETTCPACGAPVGPEAEQAFIEKKLAEVQGSLTPLAEDPDFRAMPDPVRQEILQEISTMLVSPSPPSDAELRAQIEAWRRKGFDVEPILVLLAQHPNNFRERAVRLIRSQIRKKMEGGMFRCPLCEVYLEPAAEECGNCGARFA